MPDPQRLGKYEIRGTLGRGAMGTVYRAFDPDIERLVAIKTIRIDLIAREHAEQFRDRFRNEARAAGRMHHPNIVGIYEYGEDEGNAFIAMEYVDGTDLTGYVARNGDIGVRETAALMAQLLAALEFAHGCGVVHRDIKPANLMITRDGVVKVTDFGIARIDTSHLTATGMVMGTPSYMSPEQCRGSNVDARSDLFSAGIVLYELLTGEKPFVGPSEAVAYGICHSTPVLPSHCATRQLSPAIDSLMAIALAKDPARRFPSARAFARALSDAAEDIPTQDDGLGTTRVLVTPAVTVSAATHAPTHNLPQPVTSFVGRERELTEVRHLLRSVRLLTLLGVGGLGKTRLAVQAARACVDAYPDGAWLVELAALTDARLIAPALTKALNVHAGATASALEALAAHVAGRRLLLVLDNCEHLLHACAEVVRALLQAGPGIAILATSREPLRVMGETTYPVSPLAMPDVGAKLTAESVLRFEAARLFVDRATAVEPSFRVTDENANALAGICARLDGIPLALELAAARVRVLSVAMIASRMDDRFRLLKGGDQTALPRQQTLRAMIDWSHDLLAEPQRQLLRRLAVFAGSFTLEAAEHVGAYGAIDAADILDLLSDLVEKSLVARIAAGERYRLLETVRQYALERLAEAGEEGDTRARHLACFLAFAEDVDPKLGGPAQGHWFARLDADRENFISAHAWCDHAADGAQQGLRLVQALRNWLCRGALVLGHQMAVEALARPGAQVRNLERSQGLFVAGLHDYYMGRYKEARAYSDESLGIAREIGDRLKVADTLTLLGGACLGEGDVESARRHLTEGLQLARGLGDKMRLGQALMCVAEFHSTEGNVQAALPLYQEVLLLNRETGDRSSTAVSLFNLARIAIGGDDIEQVPSMLLETLDISVELGSDREGHQLLALATALAASRGQWERAARFYGASESLLMERNFHREPADEAFLVPRVNEARKHLGAAGFLAVEQVGRGLAYAEAVAEIRVWLESG